VGHNPATIVILAFIWGVTALAGLSFLRGAYQEKLKPPAKGVRAVVLEVKFRLKLAAGAGLLLTVIGGVVWLALNWN
jgi:hypothetical protein